MPPELDIRPQLAVDMYGERTSQEMPVFDPGDLGKRSTGGQQRLADLIEAHEPFGLGSGLKAEQTVGQITS